MTRLNIASLHRLSAADQIKVLNAAEHEVTEVEDRAVNPDSHWIARRRRRIDQVRRQLKLGEPSHA